jgi:O-antigen/teichoic acid export membrane protein
MFAKIKRLLGHTLIYGLGSSGSRFVGFILLPLYTRYLTPEDYGVLALVGLLGQILFTVMALGQGPAVFRTYFNHDDPERRETVVTTSLWLILAVSFPIGLLALALNGPLTELLTGSPRYAMWMVYGTLGVAFKTLLRLPFAVLRARGQSWQFAISSFVQTAAGIILAIIFVAGLHLGGKGVLLSQLVAELLVCAYLVPVTIRGLKLRFSREDATDLLGYGIYQVPTALFGFLLHMSDRYFLKHFATLHAVGLYSLGYRFGEILSIALWTFGLAWQPFVFENKKSPEAPALYARVTTYYTAVLGLLWVAVSLLSPEVIAIMARPAFYEAHHVVPWIAGAFFFQGLAYVANIGIVLHRKIKYRPFILAAAIALNLGLNYALVPRYEMMGAAVAGCVSYGAFFVLQAAVANRLYPVPYEYGRLARLGAIGMAVYFVGSLVDWGSFWSGFAGKSLLVLAAPLLVYLTGFFEPGELTRLRDLLARFRRQPRGRLQPGGAE